MGVYVKHNKPPNLQERVKKLKTMHTGEAREHIHSAAQAPPQAGQQRTHIQGPPHLGKIRLHRRKTRLARPMGLSSLHRGRSTWI